MVVAVAVGVGRYSVVLVWQIRTYHRAKFCRLELRIAVACQHAAVDQFGHLLLVIQLCVCGCVCVCVCVCV